MQEYDRLKIEQDELIKRVSKNEKNSNNLTQDVNFLKEREQYLTTAEIAHSTANVSRDLQIQNNTTNIQTLFSDVSSLNQQMMNNNLNIYNLNNYVNEMRSYYGGTFNVYEKKTVPCGKKTYSTGQVYTTIFMLCDTSSICKVNFKIRLTIETATTYSQTVQVQFNENDIIYEKAYSLSNETLTDTLEFSYEFYPKEKSNRFKIKVKTLDRVYGNMIRILDTEVEAFGRNIVILNRDRNFKVYITKDYYYLTKNDIYTGEYKKVAVGSNFNLTSGFTPIPQLIDMPASSNTNANNIFNYNFQYLPLIVYDSVNDKFSVSQTDDRFAAVNSYNSYGFVCNASEVPVNHSNGFKYSSAMADTPSYSHPGQLPSGSCDQYMRNTSFTYCYYNYAAAMSLSTYTAGYLTSKIKVNGTAPNKKFVDNTSVFAKDWETNSHRPYYCIATDQDGNNTFFNGKDATYSVPVGFGWQVNAFMQSDGSINVYLRVVNNIHKRVLQLNIETNKYELVSDEVLCPGWEYIEGYYDDYFINEFGTWRYVPPTNN